MDKYVGLNKVDVTLKENDQVVRKEEAKEERGKGGFFKVFCVQLLVSLVLCGGLFLGKYFDIKGYSSVSGKVKDAVCFDADEYIEQLLEDKES